jgi:2-isopropylmalate synthase
MDIVTMALNLLTQGIDPELDFSDMPTVREVYKRCTRMDIHPRHPYSGELVYTAFSGSHQDAISKGMKAHSRSAEGLWDVPYLPIDPQDVGCTYEAIVRINSQSGKGGIAYVLDKEYGIQIPKWMQPDFGVAVQDVTDRTGEELSPEQIHELFQKEYIGIRAPYQLKKCNISWEDQDPEANDEVSTIISCVILGADGEFAFKAKGNGPLDAFVRGMASHTGLDFHVDEYAEHAIGHSSDALAIAYIRISSAEGHLACGSGIDSNISLASIKAIVSALNRLR